MNINALRPICIQYANITMHHYCRLNVEREALYKVTISLKNMYIKTWKSILSVSDQINCKLLEVNLLYN